MKTADLDSTQRQAVYTTAVLLYETSGPVAVEEMAHLLQWEEYAFCQPCDYRTPTIDGDCMVCGSRRPT